MDSGFRFHCVSKHNFDRELKDVLENILFQIGTTWNQYITDIAAEQLSYVIRRLVPFTEHMISVSAFTIMGEGPPTVLHVRTLEQGKDVFPLKSLPASVALARCNPFSFLAY